MKFYHGTTYANWRLIKKEGILWGIPSPNVKHRYTYLTPHIEVAKAYGEIILEIDYNPVGVDGRGIDNYGFNPPPGETCWQFSYLFQFHLDE
jgi:hypothetical protein